MISIGWDWISGFTAGAEVLFATPFRPTVYILQFGIIRIEIAWVDQHYQDLYEEIENKMKERMRDGK